MVLLIVLPVFVSVDSAKALQIKKGTMYYGLDQPVTVAWDAVLEAEGYELQLVMFDKYPQTVFEIQETIDTSITLSRPRSGNFIVRVRSWNWSGLVKRYSTDHPDCIDNPNLRCGWAYSDDPLFATVDGEPGAWWIYWQLPSVGGGGVD